ncbi:MAG: hypothetical protein QM597_07600 [Aeromicrobium sp.]|uniref:hypothetical protein n=1 Tax=Aeromicrobium sp. TaxID=1871063 RepID=UPI0039E5EA15
MSSASSAPAWRRPQVLAITGIVVIALLAGTWFFVLRDGRSAYCDDLKSWVNKSKETIAPDADLATSAKALAEGIDRRIDGAKKFSKEGPDDLRADWKLFHQRLVDVVEVFKKVGYDLTDSASIEKFATDVQSGALNNIDPALQAEAAAVQEKLADDESTKAIDAITKDAEENCGIADFQLSPTATP